METKNKNVDHAAKYSWMTKTEDLEDAFENLKERMEFLTINTQADVGSVVELQEEFAAYCEVLKTKCDEDVNDDSLEDFQENVQMWAGGHLPYVMAVRDEFIALKTALMQICRDASN